MSKRPLSALLGSLLGLACTGELTDRSGPDASRAPQPAPAPEVELLEGEIGSSSDPRTQRSLAAIERGKAEAEPRVQAAVNAWLRQRGVAYDYQGVDSVSGAAPAILVPAGGSAPPDCPYVGPGATAGGAGPSCTVLGQGAHEQAASAVAELDPNRAIPDGFAEGDGRLAEYRTWYATAVESSVEAVRVQLPHALRSAGLCDRTPTPTQSVESLGVATGRAILTDAINQQLARLGVRYHYPDPTRAQSAVLSCGLQILLGAHEIARQAVPARLAERPLCTHLGGEPIERSPYHAEYQERQREYETAVSWGILEEHVVAGVVLRNQGACLGSPLVLDLDGDGVQLGAPVWFDLLSVGAPVRASWIRPGDAFLALDRDGNGRIDDGSELFGNDADHAHGFARLAPLDGNRDGLLDARDAAFGALRLWADGDADGRSTPDELLTLHEAGVEAVGLDHVADDRVDRLGNQLRQRGRFVRTREHRGALGLTGEIIDVWLVLR